MAEGFMKMDSGDPESLYKYSFGDLPNNTVVNDPLGVGEVPDVKKAVKSWHEKTFGSKEKEIGKAANVNAASGTSGYTPMPLAYDSDVVDITRRFTPIKAMLPKVTNTGITANYFRLTERGDASWQSEDPALDVSDDTRELLSDTIKYARVTGRVTGVAEVGGAHFRSTMRREIMTKTQELNETIENTLLNGDNASNKYQPDGLINLLNQNNEDLTGDTPSLEDVDDIVNQCFVDRGAPNLLITDPFTASNLKNQIMNTVRYSNPYQSVAWGLQALSINTVVGELPMIVSQFMPNTAGDRRVLCVNTNFVEQRMLQDITFERLAKTSDSEKFFLKTYMTLVNKFPEGMGQLKNCG